MSEGREEAEWWRLSSQLAFIANKLRFSDSDPVTYPQDICPYATRTPSLPASKNLKAQMADFLAMNPSIPRRRMQQGLDGRWSQVPDSLN